MKWLIYGIGWGAFQAFYFLWNFKWFKGYSLTEWVNDIEQYEYPIDY